MYRELVTAIVPPSGLTKIMQRWKEITRNLADAPRKRPRQTLS
jgi:hypothetical protein